MVAPALWPCNTWEATIGLQWPNLFLGEIGSQLLRVVLQPQPSGAYTASVELPPSGPLSWQCQHPVSDPTSSGGFTGTATPFVALAPTSVVPWPYGPMWLGINVHWTKTATGRPYLACGLQLASFWNSRNGVIQSTGIKYPVAIRQDFPAMTLPLTTTQYQPWPANWTGWGWQLWNGDATAPAQWRILNDAISHAPPVCMNPNGNYTGATLYPNMFPQAWHAGSAPISSNTYDDDLLWLASIYPPRNPYPIWNPNIGNYDWYDSSGTWQASAYCNVPQTAPSGWPTIQANSSIEETFDPSIFNTFPPNYPPWWNAGVALILQNGNFAFSQPSYSRQAFAYDILTNVNYLALGVELGLGVYLNYLGARWLTSGSAP